MSETLTLLLTHQSTPQVARMLQYWNDYVPLSDLLIAYGGPAQEFAKLEHAQRVLIDSARLKTKDHQRQKQSYQDIFFAVSHWLEGRDYRFVHFVEYDQVPLQPDFTNLHRTFLEQERSDMIGFHLSRIDGTSNPHFLNHAADPEFAAFWRRVTVRKDASTVFTMFGSGSFWRREAFDAVAALQQTPPIYLELFIPTAAHHLGFRVRGLTQQQRYILNLGELGAQLPQFKTEGAWSLHPVKTLWG